MMNLINKLEKILGKGRVEENKDLTSLISIRTKTKAAYFFEARKREDLIKAKRCSIEFSLPILILGGGSNLAAIEEKLNFLVVKNSYIDWQLIEENPKSVIVSYSSGYPVNKMVNEMIEKSWQGFEYHLGLPGTVGGAVYNNSKWTNPVSYFGDNLLWAYLIDNQGRVKKVSRQYFHFAYDYSILHQTKEILLEAVFSLKKANQLELRKKAASFLKYRRETQPQGEFTSGCFFKNISDKDKKKLGLPTTSAGYLIDQSGLKGFSVGDFYVSGKHANFIVNKGNGRSQDLKKLLKTIKDRVEAKFGVKLEEEVIII